MNKGDLIGILRQANRPSNMTILFTLKDEIDRKTMEEAMEETMKRYPYFRFRIVKNGSDYDMAENPEPIVIFDSTDKEIILGSKEVNHHWLAASCEGREFHLTMSHAIADGRSFMWFYQTLLWCYLTKRYSIPLSSEGIHLPDSAIPDDEDVKPMSPVEDDGKMGLMQVTDPFELPDDSDGKCLYKIRISEKDFLKFGKSNDSSPVALISVFMAKMFREVYPDNKKAIYTGVAADIREAIGCPHSRFSNVLIVFVKHAPDKLDKSYERLGTMTRGQLMLQSDPINLRYKHNQVMKLSDQMQRTADPAERQRLMGQVYSLVISNPTYTLSYVGNPNWGDLGEYITEQYSIASTSKLMLEVNSAGGYFCICWMQRFKNDKYLRTFTKLIKENGIACEVDGPFPLTDPKWEIG